MEKNKKWLAVTEGGIWETQRSLRGREQACKAMENRLKTVLEMNDFIWPERAERERGMWLEVGLVNVRDTIIGIILKLNTLEKEKKKREIQATRRVENLESTKEYKVSGQRLGKPLRPRIEMYDLMIIMTSEIVKRTRHITQIVIVNLQGKIERNLLEWITFEKENQGTGREKNRESKE